MKHLSKYSLGMGDRFAHQGEAQLGAIVQARAMGLAVTPVWNKSNREHALIGSEPLDLRREADAAVAALKWDGPYHVDADHINLGTVDRFVEASDFYTIDVADYTGKAAEPASITAFVEAAGKYMGSLPIDGFAAPLVLDLRTVRVTAEKFLWAMQEAGRIYRRILEKKGGDFIAEVSVDETDTPQTPAELLLILFMLAREGVPVQTIAPKFTGRFNKGVDYVGDLVKFAREFDEDLAVVRFAVREFNLPDTLRLSVHSGSDKFSLYPMINRLLKKHDAGVHVKTAGTTWLEEVIGLAESDGEGLRIAKEVYAVASGKFEELVKPYAPVVDIDPGELPSVETVNGWDSACYVAALRHDQNNPAYNRHFRQLIHVSFKVAAAMGARYTDALKENRAIIARNVTHNLFARHLIPIFG